MGILRRWQAKMVFMIGIYCRARSPETERMRIRERRDGRGGVSAVEEALMGLVTEGPLTALERRVCCLLM